MFALSSVAAMLIFQLAIIVLFPFTTALFEPTEQEACMSYFHNLCVEDYHCCSNYCEREISRKNGVCKDGRGFSNIPEKCALIASACKKNDDCCSNKCAEKKCKLGRGFQSTKIPTSFVDNGKTEMCMELRSKKCRENYECCSNNCQRAKDDLESEFGECVEGLGFPDGVCHEYKYNLCHDDKECCSGLCFLGTDSNWEDGLCNPGPGLPTTIRSLRECQMLGSKCTVIADCCTNNCEGGATGKYCAELNADVNRKTEL